MKKKPIIGLFGKETGPEVIINTDEYNRQTEVLTNRIEKLAKEKLEEKLKSQQKLRSRKRWEEEKAKRVTENPKGVEVMVDLEPYVVNDFTQTVQVEPTGNPNEFTDGKYIFTIYPPGEGGELVDIDKEFGCRDCDCELEEIPYIDNGDGTITFSLGQVEDSLEARQNFMDELLGQKPRDPEPVDETSGWIHMGEEVVRWNEKPRVTAEQLKQNSIYYATNAYDPNEYWSKPRTFIIEGMDMKKTLPELVEEYLQDMEDIASKARNLSFSEISKRLKQTEERIETIRNTIAAEKAAEDNKEEEGK